MMPPKAKFSIRDKWFRGSEDSVAESEVLGEGRNFFWCLLGAALKTKDIKPLVSFFFFFFS